MAANAEHRVGAAAGGAPGDLDDTITAAQPGLVRQAAGGDGADLQAGLGVFEHHAKAGWFWRWLGLLRRYENGRREPGLQVGALAVGRYRQQAGNLAGTQSIQLVRHAMAVADVAAAHDANNQRRRGIFLRAACLVQAFGHGAIPGQLAIDEALEGFFRRWIGLRSMCA